MLPEEYLSLQREREISGNFTEYLSSQIGSPCNSNYFPLQVQTSASKQINSVIIPATTRALLNGGGTEWGVPGICWHQKLPERIFCESVASKNIFWVFSCLAARPVKAYIALPMRKAL